jgi:hypothetical protein
MEDRDRGPSAHQLPSLNLEQTLPEAAPSAALGEGNRPNIRSPVQFVAHGTPPPDIPPLVEDAVHLIMYLSGSGANPRAETISAVFAAKKAIQEDTWCTDVASSFFEAFSELSKQATPVTAQSLAESESVLVGRKIKHWDLVVWVLLPILMLLSALSYANSRFAASADKLIQQSYTVEKPGSVPAIPANADGGAPTAAPRGLIWKISKTSPRCRSERV